MRKRLKIAIMMIVSKREGQGVSVCASPFLTRGHKFLERQVYAFYIKSNRKTVAGMMVGWYRERPSGAVLTRYRH